MARPVHFPGRWGVAANNTLDRLFLAISTALSLLSLSSAQPIRPWTTRTTRPQPTSPFLVKCASGGPPSRWYQHAGGARRVVPRAIYLHRLNVMQL